MQVFETYIYIHKLTGTETERKNNPGSSLILAFGEFLSPSLNPIKANSGVSLILIAVHKFYSE